MYRYPMLHFSRGKIAAITFVVMAGLLFAAPSFLPSSAMKHWPSWLPSTELRVSPEIAGGSKVVLRVDRAAMTRTYYEQWQANLRDVLREIRIAHAGITVEPNALLVLLQTTEEREGALAKLSEHYHTGFMSTVRIEATGEKSIRLSVSQATIDREIDKSIDAAIAGGR